MAQLVARVAVLLVLAMAGCEADTPGDPQLQFRDGGSVSTDAGGPRDTGSRDLGALDVATPDVPPLDVPPTDAGCVLDSPYREFAVLAGTLSSYSRGEAYPSLRQWADRARTQGFRGMLLADQMRRTDGANPVNQFSDARPEADPFQHVFRFDASFDMLRPNGEGAVAELITKEQDPDIASGTGVWLKGAEGGWSSAAYEDETGFDYDLQDVHLVLAVKVPRKTGDARVLARVSYGPKQNPQPVTWVLSWSGDPGEGTLADFNAAATMHTYELPLKDQVVAQYGALHWSEGALWRIELRIEGDAEAVFDNVNLRVDAYYDVYREEATRYSDSQIQFVPGVEHNFSLARGQFNCHGAESFPASDKDADGGLVDDLHAAGCFVVANRPRAPGATTSADRVQLADAFEVWHPAFAVDANPDLAFWDAQLLQRQGPFPALASAFLHEVNELTGSVPHNVVLTETLTDEGLLDALAAGRFYLVDDASLSVELWGERPGCQRAEMGEEVGDVETLHARVSCPDGVASAELLRVELPDGVQVRYPVTNPAEGATFDVADWPQSFVRLEATCLNGARAFTNPLWLVP